MAFEWIGIVALILVMIVFVYSTIFILPKILEESESYEEKRLRKIIKSEFKRNKVEVK